MSPLSHILWPLLVALLLLLIFWRPIVWIVFTLVLRVVDRFEKRRSRDGAVPCPVCGYDVRGTLHGCPECGTKLRWGMLP